ncbi:30S ribosomal protein S20 [Clostridium grantii]|uniref:Small ribosomal subunit protein bS20 n=1 Tax=Clostridium grantii DSM 8605 TaxID=1121316 RepID=A0A1M5XKE0_9CLOT|nr:30S ribosomal protein S20 [Clostridium grantii]SHI00280.1 small subunit ribosomal protein S20 [Clostridium grantii DSM 8605]
MANVQSAKKKIKVIKTKTLRNKMIKSALKTQIKKFEVALESNNASTAAVELKACVKALDMAASKGVLHKNKVARTKSRLTAKLNGLSA